MWVVWTGQHLGRKIREKLARLSNQWFEICMLAIYEKHASEDNTGIDSVQRSLVTQWRKTEHTLNKIRNNSMLRKGATDMLEGGGTTKRDLERLEE